MSAYTLDQVEKLKEAIAQGTLRVQYADKLIEYRSLDEMIRILDMMSKELGLVPKNGGRKFASHTKGLE